MPPVHSSPYRQMEPALFSLLHHTATAATTEKRSSKRTSTTGGLLRIFKLFPMLTSGCKMVALLASGRPRKSLLTDRATTGTLFGHRKGRLTLTIQEDPHRLPVFVIELPSSPPPSTRRWPPTSKIGYSIRRKQMSEDEVHVMQLLRGVSMGAGVLPPPPSEKETVAGDGELTYIRASIFFVRVH
ncbi:MIZU-KUSSEI-like protein [Actinidia rufa]|uniref:MIZU-KUSSEI-like protein n=1 Tax=Actinidia rufa TaxID=165716 RepID=A0A7J0DDW0_9ERIC|nr:MIZU-KUSSEI-like protein [Actinidia rufa]